MNRRRFLQGLFATSASGLLVPKEKIIFDMGKNLWRESSAKICGDFLICHDTKVIRYVGKGQSYSVLEFHRWLQDLADDVPCDDSVIDITSPNPSTRITDSLIVLENEFSLSSKASDFLKDGQIVQRGLSGES